VIGKGLKKKRKKKEYRNQAWWIKLLIPSLGTLRQEDIELQISLGYIVRPCLKKIKIKTSQALVVMTVILATQEAEIRRITVCSQPREIVRSYFENPKIKKGW
jgi:hypothetical protein